MSFWNSFRSASLIGREKIPRSKTSHAPHESNCLNCCRLPNSFGERIACMTVVVCRRDAIANVYSTCAAPGNRASRNSFRPSRRARLATSERSRSSRLQTLFKFCMSLDWSLMLISPAAKSRLRDLLFAIHTPHKQKSLRKLREPRTEPKISHRLFTATHVVCVIQTPCWAYVEIKLPHCSQLVTLCSGASSGTWAIGLSVIFLNCVLWHF